MHNGRRVAESGAIHEGSSWRACFSRAVWRNVINDTMCLSSLMIARHYRLLSVSNETPLEKIMRFNNMLTALAEIKNELPYLTNYRHPKSIPHHGPALRIAISWRIIHLLVKRLGQSLDNVSLDSITPYTNTYTCS